MHIGAAGFYFTRWHRKRFYSPPVKTTRLRYLNLLEDVFVGQVPPTQGSSLTSRRIRTIWETKYKNWTQAHRNRGYGSGEARADPSDVSVYNSEMKFGRITVDAIDGVHVLRAGRHYNNHIAQCLQFDPVLWFRDSGLKSRAAIWGDGNVHP